MKCCGFYMLLLALTMHINDAVCQILQQSRSTVWTNAGYKSNIPVYDTIRNITDYGGNGNGIAANDTALVNAINSLNNQSGTIYFSAGVFVFNHPVVLRSNLILKGAGAANTILKFNLGGNFSLINISGSNTSSISNVRSDISKGAFILTVDDPSLFAVNDHIKIYHNDSSLINDSWALESVGQIVRIDSIKMNSIYFSNPLRRGYSVNKAPKIRKLEMIKGVGIECLKIKRMDATVQQTANIRFNNAADCWVKGVESDSCNFAHIQLAASTNVSVTNNYFHNAFMYGEGGKAYGVSCEYTSGDCLIENNIFRHLRHSMLLQSGANGNVFAYNYSTEPFKTDTIPYDFSGDIVLHGNYPYLNLFEGNIVQNIVIDASHGRNGPYNTFFRNRAERYGLLVSPVAGDSTNIIGNEITGTGFQQGNYYAFGTGNLHYANNKNDTIIPTGTGLLQDKSYFYSSTPSFWSSRSQWAGIGPTNILSSNNIPAKERFAAAQELAYCLSSTPVVYHFTGNGNWSTVTNWENNLQPPAVLSNGSEIIIDPPAGQKFTLNINYIIQPGINLIIRPSKIFEVLSHLTFVK
jgi:hypothetical protein